jgi:hypothetical protein
MSVPVPRESGNFSAALRGLGQGLALPLPRRVRILRELAYDLEELSGRMVEQGVPPEEARRRAQEALIPGPESLRQLDRIHRPWYRRTTEGLPPGRLQLAERAALALVTGVVLVLEGWALRRVDLFGDPSPFLVPVMAVGTAMATLLVAKTFQLFVKGDHARPGEGLGTILVSAAATLGLGLAGTGIDFYRLAAQLESTPGLATEWVPLWLGRTAVLLAVSLLMSLAGAMGWFVLRQWVALAEGAQREILDPRSNPHLKGRTS